MLEFVFFVLLELLILWFTYEADGDQAGTPSQRWAAWFPLVVGTWSLLALVFLEIAFALFTFAMFDRASHGLEQNFSHYVMFEGQLIKACVGPILLCAVVGQALVMLYLYIVVASPKQFVSILASSPTTKIPNLASNVLVLVVVYVLVVLFVGGMHLRESMAFRPAPDAGGARPSSSSASPGDRKKDAKKKIDPKAAKPKPPPPTKPPPPPPKD